MNKKYFKILSLVVLVVLILTIISMGIFSFSNKDKTKVVETKTFSEIPGFSFEYPVFERWNIGKIEKINDSEYVMWISVPKNINFEVPPSMKINKINNYQQTSGMVVDPISFEIKNNPQGISYGVPGDGSLEFYTDGFRIVIKPFNHEGDGYSGKSLAEKIIETFKFFGIPKEQAMQIAQTDAVGAYKDLSIYDVSASLETDGWHVDYKLKDPVMLGGGPHYVIDSSSGEIISKRYDQ